MKIHYCITLILVSLATIVSSRDIKMQEAEKVAISFYQEKFPQPKLNAIIPFASTFDLSDNLNKPGYFVFNLKSSLGFIIVSSSDNLSPILGFSFEGSYIEDHQNEAFDFWMENLTKYSFSDKNKKKFESEWKGYLEGDANKMTSTEGVDPLLTIAWGQSCYYNYLCPVDSAGSCYHARTGCGATAMAMILKYWDYPEHGFGSNMYENPPYGILSADFENTYYDWLNMPPQLNSSSTPTELNAVGELMFQCGMAVDMVYATNASSSDNWNIRNAFTDVFDYSSESQFIDKVDYHDTVWCDILQNEMDNGRPVFYGISSGSGGHFVVMDGYQDDEYFHYSWGYANLNGYYKTFDELPVIQQAIIGIEPNNEKLSGAKEFTAYNGVFNDGSNHDQYLNNRTYQWLISLDSATSITLLFTKFTTEYQMDFVNIYDGETAASPLLGSFSGHKLPPVVQSGGNKVLIEFITNSSISDEGWTMRYTSVRNNLSCSGLSVLTDSIGNFDDGSGAAYYIDNADCFWLIKPDTASSINLHFEYFYTETDWDFLYVYNGENPSEDNLLATLTGNILPLDISSTEGAILLHFHSDWNTHRPGWEVSYSANYERIYTDIKVFLEGPFLSSEMSAGLNSILPHHQPYDVNLSANCYYEGDEFVSEIPNSEIVDWVLVELRDAATAEFASPETRIAQQVAFLLRDGSVVGLDGASTLQFSNSINEQLFVVIRHRNHLPIMSAVPLVLNGNTYLYDFTTGSATVYGGADGHHQIATDIWGMISGDANSDGAVDANDKQVNWENETGRSGYLQSDFDLQGQSDNIDKNSYCLPNVGRSSMLPE